MGRATSVARGIVAALDAADGVIALACRVVVALTGAALLGILAANVVARYVLARGGFSSAQELPEQLFPWFIAAGVVLAARQGAHIAVDVLARALPRAGRRVLLTLVHLLVAGAYLWLGLLALEVAEIAALQRTTILRLSGSYGYWALAALAMLTAWTSLAIALRVLLAGPEAAPDPASEAA
ncbi:MAG: TRAP transporter small permease subunit [Acetobacteraceae bacterium]